jgi:hypothetical protein
MTTFVRQERAQVGHDGRVLLEGLDPDGAVDVFVYRVEQAPVDPAKYRGQPYRLDRPFDAAVPPQAWDALR